MFYVFYYIFFFFFFYFIFLFLFMYHPEFQSKPNKPHPLFKGFIQACLAHQS
jgi:CTP synthase (UTP-ammonia lyase)